MPQFSSVAILMAVMGTGVSPAWSAGFCQTLENVTQDADQGTAPLDGLVVNAPAPVCGTSRAPSNAISTYCYWAFAYRSDTAGEVFERIVEQVQTCPAASTPTQADRGVNHPDSYDLRRFDLGDQTVSVSLKDKGGLQKTLVFLRVETPVSVD